MGLYPVYISAVCCGIITATMKSLVSVALSACVFVLTEEIWINIVYEEYKMIKEVVI